MLNKIIDTFINLDEPNKNKLLDILSTFVNPIKLYLITIILLLLIMCIVNFFIYRKFNDITISAKIQ
jgi:hypothetical protein